MTVVNEKGEEELMYIKNIVQKELTTTTSEVPVSTNGVPSQPMQLPNTASAAPVVNNVVPISGVPSQPTQLPNTASTAPVINDVVPISAASVMTNGDPSQPSDCTEVSAPSVTSYGVSTVQIVGIRDASQDNSSQDFGDSSVSPTQEQISTPTWSSNEVAGEDASMDLSNISIGPTQQEQISTPHILKTKLPVKRLPWTCDSSVGPLNKSKSVPLLILKMKLPVKRFPWTLVIVLSAPLKKSKSVTPPPTG